MKLTREIDGLCEIVYDVAQNLHCRLNNMEDGERDALMDALDGSRGLFWQHAYLWAQEYHGMWEALAPDQRNERSENYLAHIDEFVKAKFEALLTYLPADVASVQVVPAIHYPARDEHNEYTEAQFNGPTEDTSCWAVYLRDRGGLAHWKADSADEDTAMLLGGALAAKYGVEIEPQLWKTNLSEKPE